MCQVYGCERPGSNERKLGCTCPVNVCDDHLAELRNGKRLTAASFLHGLTCTTLGLKGTRKRYQLLAW